MVGRWNFLFGIFRIYLSIFILVSGRVSFLVTPIYHSFTPLFCSYRSLHLPTKHQSPDAPWDWKHLPSYIFIYHCTINFCHPCRYNPRSLTLRPVEKCQTWQRLSPASFWGFSGLWPIFSGFCWKNFQILPDLPFVPSFRPTACRPFVTKPTDIGTWLSARLPNKVWLRRWSCPKTWVQQCKSPTTYGATYGRYLSLQVLWVFMADSIGLLSSKLS